jgi:hypothetical protein
LRGNSERSNRAPRISILEARDVSVLDVHGQAPGPADSCAPSSSSIAEHGAHAFVVERSAALVDVAAFLTARRHRTNTPGSRCNPLDPPGRAGDRIDRARAFHIESLRANTPDPVPAMISDIAAYYRKMGFVDLPEAKEGQITLHLTLAKIKAALEAQAALSN